MENNFANKDQDKLFLLCMMTGETLHYYKILNYCGGLCQGQMAMFSMTTPLTGDSIWLICFSGWGTVKQFSIQTFNRLPNVSIYY